MRRSIVLSDRAIEALVAFSWYRCDNTKPNLEIAKHAVSTAKAFRIKSYIASSLWCFGVTYKLLGDCRAAYGHLQEAYRLFIALLPGDLKLQQLCCRCGNDLIQVGVANSTFEDSDKGVFSLVRDVEKQIATGTVLDDLVHVLSVITVGVVVEDPQEAWSMPS